MTYPPTGASCTCPSCSTPLSRRIVKSSMASNLRTGPVLSALEMAPPRRRPPWSGVHHSRRASQCPSLAFSPRCREAGVRSCLDKARNNFDNTMGLSLPPPTRMRAHRSHGLPKPAGTRGGSSSATSRAGKTPHRRHSRTAGNRSRASTSRRATQYLNAALDANRQRNRGNSTLPFLGPTLSSVADNTSNSCFCRAPTRSFNALPSTTCVFASRSPNLYPCGSLLAKCSS